MKPAVFDLLGRISGSLLVVYVLAKCVDTLVWINHTSSELGVHPARFYDFAPVRHLDALRGDRAARARPGAHPR